VNHEPSHPQVAARSHHRRHGGILVWLPTAAQAGISLNSID
jgi:hypothetical protein